MKVTITEIERIWFAAVDAAESSNPIMAFLGPRTDGDVLAFRQRLIDGGLTLSTDHAASSYGIPVVVDSRGCAYGPGEWISLAADLR